MHFTKRSNDTDINTNINTYTNQSINNITHNINSYITPLSPNMRKKGLIDMMNNISLLVSLRNAVLKWLQYKRYGYEELSMQSFIDKVVKCTEEYGETEVVNVINESIANLYSGVAWSNLNHVKKRENVAIPTGNYYVIADSSPSISEEVLFYVEVLKTKAKDCMAILTPPVHNRFIALVEEVSHKQSIRINEYPVEPSKILYHFVDFFRDDGSLLLQVYDRLDIKIAEGNIKNNFNYAVSMLYNASRME